ncbi:MAG TPA: adenylate/guanylate cyclase domain-containing protein, partial [Elusimicrobiales bacterium]|nr:adenylate/guanylate cyclase domain-containing protein [Elusimicrobiales bacterium]
MENKTKAKTKTGGNKKLYIGTAVFTLLWVFVVLILDGTQRLDYNWEHLIVNLPSRLSVLDLGAKERSNQYAFGKYVNKPASPKITITAIDELTLDRYGWPIKRKYYGELVEKLKKLGAKSIVFDVIMSRSERDVPEDNNQYVEAVARVGNVGNLVHIDLDTLKVKPPIKGLSKASAIMAQPHVDLTLDGDGQVRRYMPFYIKDTDLDGFPDTPVTYTDAGLLDLKCGQECLKLPIPSIGLAAYALYSGEPLSVLYMKYETERILNYRDYVSRKLHPAWDKDPNSLKASSFRHISFSDILSGQLSQEEKDALKGGITLVGSTAIGAFDHMPSPLSSQLPGVEVHATFTDNLMAGDFRTALSLEYTTLLLLFLPWLPVLLRKYSLALLISVCSAVIAVMFVASIALLSNNIIMPFGSIFLSLFIPFAYITVDKGLAEGREKKWIKNTFGQYLSPKVVDLITKDPSKLSLGGEKRDMTAFFLDLAGFTTMSEKLTPEELTSMLNEYLSAFTEIILKHDGTVDK